MISFIERKKAVQTCLPLFEKVIAPLLNLPHPGPITTRLFKLKKNKKPRMPILDKQKTHAKKKKKTVGLCPPGKIPWNL